MTARTGQNEEQPGAEAPEVVSRDGAGPALIICEHASNHVPSRYGGLGLSPGARDSHAAWDLGARDVALGLAEALDSPMVAARVSRLVYDCNRPPEAGSAMPVQVERIEVPGNRGLDVSARIERTESIYNPFCAAVDGIINTRCAAGRSTALITVHSFTPVWFDTPRTTHIGILHDDDTRLADAVLARAGRLPHRLIARNDPYGPVNGVTHSLRLHGLRHGLPNVMIEVRNDLLTGVAGRAQIVRELLSLLRPALAELPVTIRSAEPPGEEIHA